MSHRVTSIRLTQEQFAKVDKLAAELGSNRNQVFGQLVDNAAIGEVLRREPVSLVSNKNISAAKLSQGNRGADVVGSTN